MLTSSALPQELGHRDVRRRGDRLRCQLSGLRQEILHRACGSCQKHLIAEKAPWRVLTKVQSSEKEIDMVHLEKEVSR